MNIRRLPILLVIGLFLIVLYYTCSMHNKKIVIRECKRYYVNNNKKINSIAFYLRSLDMETRDSSYIIHVRGSDGLVTSYYNDKELFFGDTFIPQKSMPD